MKNLLIILTIYSFLSCLKLEYENYRPGYSLLASYHNRDKVGGSEKIGKTLWEQYNEPTRSFYYSLWLCGIPVYLTSNVSLILGTVLIIKQDKRNRLIAIICSAICLSILILFISQGVFSVAMKWG